MCLALLLFQDFRASLAKVGQMHETDSLRLEHVFRRDTLTREGSRS